MVQQQEFIDLQLLMTPQEHLLTGGTLENDPEEERGWYIPVGVQKGTISIKQATDARKRLGVIKTGLGRSLKLSNNVLAIGCQDLDPITGETVADPIVLGIYNANEERKYREVEGRDLTRELYKIFRESGMELHLRGESVREREGRPPGPEM